MTKNVLWKVEPGVADNWTGPHFLERLVLNADVQGRSYWAVVHDAQTVSLQVCIVSSVLQVHGLLLSNQGGVYHVLVLVLGLILFGQVFVRQITGRQLGGNLIRALRQSSLLIAGVYFLSPLYSTLAKAISGDTVTAASVWLLASHLYMHDYFFQVSVATKLSGSLSMAAGVAASLLLASRLGSPQKVFAQILYSITAFVLLPFTCQHIKTQSNRLYRCILILALSATSLGLYCMCWKLFPAYIILHGSLLYLCPWCLLHIEKYKAKISGPWDEAVPKLSKTLKQSYFLLDAEDNGQSQGLTVNS